MNILAQCPGMYCGRELLSDGNWSDCGACPRGFRVNASSACVPCDDTPTFYDWLYLGFMALLALVLHWFCIDTVSMRRNIPKEVIALHLSALLEIVLASFIALQLTYPVGTFGIKSCRVKKLSDWYTLLHNPSPNYEATLHCTQEAVYPLYTIVFIFYALGIVLMLLIRPIIAKKFLPKQGKLSIYAALYFYPILTLLHAFSFLQTTRSQSLLDQEWFRAGLNLGDNMVTSCELQTALYWHMMKKRCLENDTFLQVLPKGKDAYSFRRDYSFPYITIILSVLSNAAHFAFKLNQKMKSLLLNSISDIKNVIVILGHWLLHGYGVIAVATLRGLNIHPAMLALVPLPALFYILTARFTDPHKLHIE